MPDTTPATIEKDDEEALTREQAELLIRLARQATAEVPSYADRIHKCPALFDVECN
jgi:hypothetical protein